MIPQSFIQDLLARADIVDVVGRAVQLKKAGINYKVVVQVLPYWVDGKLTLPIDRIGTDLNEQEKAKLGLDPMQYFSISVSQA